MTIAEILQKLRETKRGPIGLTGLMALLKGAQGLAERDTAQREKWSEENPGLPYPGDMMGPGLTTTPFRVPMRVSSLAKKFPDANYTHYDMPRFLRYNLRNRLDQAPFNIDVDFALQPDARRAYLSMLNSKSGSGAPGSATPAVGGTRFKGTSPQNLENALGRVAEDLGKAGYEEIATGPISKGRYRLFERIVQKLKESGQIPQQMRLKMSDPGPSYEGPAVQKIRDRKLAEADARAAATNPRHAENLRRLGLDDIPMGSLTRSDQEAIHGLVTEYMNGRISADDLRQMAHEISDTGLGHPNDYRDIGRGARGGQVYELPDVPNTDMEIRNALARLERQHGEPRSSSVPDRASKERAATAQVMQEINALPEGEREAWMRVQNVDPSRIRDTLSPEELRQRLRGIPAPQVDLNSPVFRRNASMIEGLPPEIETQLRSRPGMSNARITYEDRTMGRPENPEVAARRARYLRDLENEDILRSRYERRVQPLNRFSEAASEANVERTGNIYSPEYVDWLERRRVVEPEIIELYRERTRGRTP